ncbi:MAG: DUF362 domain-containing protein [Oscillospiraceae bacterium]|nr:DUF362 domain-containing protein [Oscillospiraceae bacterium]
MSKSKVYLVASEDRKTGAERCLAYWDALDYTGKQVYVKPNFNTADPAPGSTHNDTLETILAAVRAANPKKIILGERSGPAVVAEVYAVKNIAQLCEKYDAEFLNLENISKDDWVKIEGDDFHWQGGLEVPRALVESDIVVGMCCLKTHGFGGIYSNSLKLAVGLTPKDMMKLHGSPNIRKMIAEINVAYTPDFIISDAVEVFTDGGPMDGKRNSANVTFIGNDRIALDGAGLALLKSLGSNAAIMDTPIFQQEQISRAVELGLGVTSAEDIELVTDDEASEAVAEKIREFLI